MLDLSNVIAIALGADDVLQVQDSLGTVLWRKSYLVTITAGSNGSVTVNGVSGNYSQRVAAGTTLTIEGTGDAGYDFDEWSDGVSTNPRTITVTGDLTLSASFVQAVMLNYFYVEDASGNSNTLSITKTSNGNAIEVFASTNQRTWTSMGTTSTTPITATIPANGKLYLKATTSGIWGASWWNTGNSITASGNYNVGGCLTSLLYGDNFENTVLPNRNDLFNNVFMGSTTLVSAANLVLPTNVYLNCYNKLFYGCTALTTPPATLPATTLTGGTSCYADMFNGCTSLTTAPALPATTLEGYCYAGMFYGCSSLTETPVLPATTLGESSYNGMFNGCTSLNKVYTYANIISATNCTANWLNNVAATGDFYNLGTATYTVDSASGIPVGWTEHHYLPIPCNVSISAGSNGTVSVNGVSGDYSDTVMSGTQLTLVATPDNGYYLVSWSDGDTNASRTITVTSDLTLTASFAQVVNYNVSVSAGSNGSVSVNGVSGDYSQSVAAGTTLTLAATADSGYEFDEWSDNVSTNPRTITVTGNITLTASFVVEQQLNNEIWYETNNNQTADFSNTGFSGTQTSNTYSNNKGVATYSGNITSTSGNSSTSRATNLTKISFPDTLTSIGQHSFDGCPLTEIDFNNVTSVGYEAFDNNHIQHLHIPATLTTITNNPFRSSYITQITVDANNPNYNDGSAHNGSNCIYQGTTLISGCVNTVIPDNCTIIGDWSMSNNSSLTTLNLPASVTQLKVFAADSNPNLRTVYARSNPSFSSGVFANGVPTGGTLYYTSNVNYQNWLSQLPSGWTAVLLCDTTVSAGSNGSVSVDGVSGNYHQPELPSGTQLTLVATPAAGYQFDSWSDGDTNATRTVTITADTTLTASFVVAPEYKIKATYYVDSPSTNVHILNSTTGVTSMEIDGVTMSPSTYKVLGSTQTDYKSVWFTLSSSTVDVGSMFVNIEKLSSITIGENITGIAKTGVTLNNYVWFKTVLVESGNTVFDERGWGCVETATNTLVLGGGATTIDATVTTIGEKALAGVAYRTNMSGSSMDYLNWTIPATVTAIGDNAFWGTPKVNTLNLYSRPTVGTNALEHFGDNNSTLHIVTGTSIAGTVWQTELVDNRQTGYVWTICADL